MQREMRESRTRKSKSQSDTRQCSSVAPPWSGETRGRGGVGGGGASDYRMMKMPTAT